MTRFETPGGEWRIEVIRLECTTPLRIDARAQFPRACHDGDWLTVTRRAIDGARLWHGDYDSVKAMFARLPDLAERWGEVEQVEQPPRPIGRNLRVVA